MELYERERVLPLTLIRELGTLIYKAVPVLEFGISRSSLALDSSDLESSHTCGNHRWMIV